jgi:hypothetical protein
MGKTDSDPKEDKADHILAVPTAAIDPICLSPPKSNSEDDGEVYMVGNREELHDKMVKEIRQETEIELARTALLAWEAERGKRHNGM